MVDQEESKRTSNFEALRLKFAQNCGEEQSTIQKPRITTKLFTEDKILKMAEEKKVSSLPNVKPPICINKPQIATRCNTLKETSSTKTIYTIQRARTLNSQESQFPPLLPKLNGTSTPESSSDTISEDSGSYDSSTCVNETKTTIVEFKENLVKSETSQSINCKLKSASKIHSPGGSPFSGSKIEAIKKIISPTVENQLNKPHLSSKELFSSRENLTKENLLLKENSLSKEIVSSKENLYPKANTLSKENLLNNISKELSHSNSSQSSLVTKKYRRVQIKSKEELGKPPAKPFKLKSMKLPDKVALQIPPPPSYLPPSLPQRPSLNRVLPPRPPPVLNSSGKLSDETECDFYDDTTPFDRPVSLIPELTEEEEVALEVIRKNSLRPFPLPSPPVDDVDQIDEDIYEAYDDTVITRTETHSVQDTSIEDGDEFYEGFNDYEISDSRKSSFASRNSTSDANRESKKLQAEREKKEKKERERIKKEQKLKEEEERKIKKKFSLTGNEFVVDTGIVKEDCKGGKIDLNAKKGDKVFIIRMDNNPIGKWLAKNEEGKVGYVDLTNIEVQLGREKEDLSCLASILNIKASDDSPELL